MSGTAMIFLVLIGGFVWGGFVALVIRAARREAGKRDAGGPAGG